MYGAPSTRLVDRRHFASNARFFGGKLDCLLSMRERRDGLSACIDNAETLQLIAQFSKAFSRRSCSRRSCL